MLRHAEMPKGSRQVPTVYDGFILGLPHGSAGRLLLLSATLYSFSSLYQAQSYVRQGTIVTTSRFSPATAS